jgi:hypothetical protein
MKMPCQTGLAGRERSLLDRARANGYLNANSKSRPTLVRAHGFWCWKLRIPLICFERNSPRSKYGSVHLDLFTTPHVLTEPGRAELATLSGRAALSPYDGVWTNVPAADLEDVARSIYRIVTRRGNYTLRPPTASPELAKLIAALHETVPLQRSA